MKNCLKIAICDDLEADRISLKEMLRAYLSRQCVEYSISEYSCGENLLAEYEEGLADFSVLFLDIYMKEMSGIKAARKIRETDDKVKIVFTTSSLDFALEGYEVGATAYLLKPLSAEKLEQVLEKILVSEDFGERRQCILLRNGSHQISVYHREIMYVESMKRELLFYLTDGGCIQTYGKLNDLEQEMSNGAFLRCHQSYLVNMNYIRSAGEDFVMTTGHALPIRKREQKAIRDKYFKYMVEMSLRR